MRKGAVLAGGDWVRGVTWGTSGFALTPDAGATRYCCRNPWGSSGRYSQSEHREAGLSKRSKGIAESRYRR